MAKISVLAGSTSQSVTVFIQDSSSTTGAGLTGLVYNSASLVAYYTFAGANAGSVQITLATLAAVNSAYSSGGFKEIDATNMPGVYRLDLPDAALAAAKGRSVFVLLKGATNMAPRPLEIELTGWDNQDGTVGGLSELTALAADADEIIATLGAAGAGLTAIPDSATITEINADVDELLVGVIVTTNNDKTGYSIGAGGINRAALAADTGLVSVRSNTAQAGAAGTITLDASASASDSFYNGLTCELTGATGAGQARVITGYVAATKVATLDRNWATNPDATTTFALLNTDAARLDSNLRMDAGSIGGTLQTAADIGSLATEINADTDELITTIGAAGAGLTAVGDTAGTTTLLTRIPGTVQPQTGDSYARLGAPTGASISADLVEIEAETDGIAAIPTTPVLTSHFDTIIGTPVVSIAADIAEVEGETDGIAAIPTTPVLTAHFDTIIGTPAGASIAADIAEVEGETDTLLAGVTVTTNNDKAGYALTAGERTSIADALLDETNGIETSLTLRQAMRVALASLAGKLSGAATTTVTIRNVGDTKNRITATVDANGNRSAVTTDGT